MEDDKSFVESLLKLYKSGKHTDVEFVVGLDKQSFHSHQVVLMARSEVFEAMFSGSWTDGKRKVQIVIPDTESQAFALFLEYMHGNVFPSSVPEVIEVMHVAQKYMVGPLNSKCEDYLMKNLKLEYLIDIYLVARLYSKATILEEACKLMITNFISLQDQPNFDSLDETSWINILTRADLTLDECSIFKTVYKWAQSQLNDEEYKELGISKALKNLIPLVRFPTMSPEEFADVVVPTNILPVETVIDMFVYFNGSQGNRLLAGSRLGFSMTPRRAVDLHNLYAFDAEDSSELSDLESSSVILLRLAEMDMTPCRKYLQDIEI